MTVLAVVPSPAVTAAPLYVIEDQLAALIETVVTDPTRRGAAIDIGGPEDLSFVDLVRAVEEVTGKNGASSHVPLPMMRAMAVLMKPLNPALARQIQGGVVMDTTDLTFATVKRHASSWIQGATTLRDVVVRDYVREAAGVQARSAATLGR